MNNREVKLLCRATDALANYVISNDIKNFDLNKIILRNSTILERAEKEINKTVPTGLFELEEKMKVDSEELWDKLNEAEQKSLNRFDFGLNKASEEDKETHKKLMVLYDELMEKESDVILFKLNEDCDIKEVKLPLLIQATLDKFLIPVISENK